MILNEEEQMGQLALTNIVSSIWLGDWDRYEAIFRQMSEDVKAQFPFHLNYEREEVKLWHENHFFIPGNYFIPPYFSSYKKNNEDGEERKKDLLCLIATYEKLGFFYPLEQEMYPDHIGCITAFIGAVQQEKVKAIQEEDADLFTQLESLETNIRNNYLFPLVEGMQEKGQKLLQHDFFKQFLHFQYELMKEEHVNH